MKKTFLDKTEKVIISSLTAIATLSVLLIAAGTPNTAVQRGLESFMTGGNAEDVAYATTNSVTNKAKAEEILKNVGVENPDIIITDDERNCALWDNGMFGQKIRKYSDDGTDIPKQGGCWRSSTPDTIYISSELTNLNSLRFVTLHEYAHVLQERGEWPREIDTVTPDETSNECLADVWANQNGSPVESLSYFAKGDCEDYRYLLDGSKLKSVGDKLNKIS